MVLLRSKRTIRPTYHSVAIQQEDSPKKQAATQAKAAGKVSFLVAHRTAILIVCGIIAMAGVTGIGVASQYFSSSSSSTVRLFAPVVIASSSSTAPLVVASSSGGSSSSSTAAVSSSGSSSTSTGSSSSSSTAAGLSSSSSTASSTSTVPSSSSSSTSQPYSSSSSSSSTGCSVGYDPATNCTSCLFGYVASTNCSKTYCDLSPCLNGGTCTNSASGSSCNCVNGYTGTTCQLTHCDGNPCNHGTCTHTASSFTCSCDFGYNPSTNCAQTYCQTNPCGACTSNCSLSATSRTCNCMPGWGGSICTGKTDDEFGTCSYVYNSSSCAVAAGNPCANQPFAGTCVPYQGCIGLHVQQAKLRGTGYVATDPYYVYEGQTTALSQDGNTLALGGPLDNSQTGAVWVLVRSGSTWSQQGTKLVGTGAVGPARQGWGLALSADGNTLASSGTDDNSYTGAAWVFTRSAGVWTQQGSKLVGTGITGSQPQQGFAVALSADGNTLALSSPYDNSNAGAVWIFTRSAGVWTQQGAKLAGPGTNSQMGSSLALSADGSTLTTGAPRDSANFGAVLVFTSNAGVWSQQGSKLVGTGSTGAAFQGTSVALSNDGNTLASGGYADNSNNGAVWLFGRVGSTWTQQGSKLVSAEHIGSARQGVSVSLSATATRLAVGGSNDNSQVGAAWVWTNAQGSWTQYGSKIVGTNYTGAYNPNQGTSVSLSGDGNTLSVGGPLDFGQIGSVWVFV